MVEPNASSLGARVDESESLGSFVDSVARCHDGAPGEQPGYSGNLLPSSYLLPDYDWSSTPCAADSLSDSDVTMEESDTESSASSSHGKFDHVGSNIQTNDQSHRGCANCEEVPMNTESDSGPPRQSSVLFVPCDSDNPQSPENRKAVPSCSYLKNSDSELYDLSLDSPPASLKPQEPDSDPSTSAIMDQSGHVSDSDVLDLCDEGIADCSSSSVTKSKDDLELVNSNIGSIGSDTESDSTIEDSVPAQEVSKGTKRADHLGMLGKMATPQTQISWPVNKIDLSAPIECTNPNSNCVFDSWANQSVTSISNHFTNSADDDNLRTDSLVNKKAEPSSSNVIDSMDSQGTDSAANEATDKAIVLVRPRNRESIVRKNRNIKLCHYNMQSTTSHGQLDQSVAKDQRPNVILTAGVSGRIATGFAMEDQIPVTGPATNNDFHSTLEFPSHSAGPPTHPSAGISTELSDRSISDKGSTTHALTQQIMEQNRNLKALANRESLRLPASLGRLFNANNECEAPRKGTTVSSIPCSHPDNESEAIQQDAGEKKIVCVTGRPRPMFYTPSSTQRSSVTLSTPPSIPENIMSPGCVVAADKIIQIRSIFPNHSTRKLRRVICAVEERHSERILERVCEHLLNPSYTAVCRHTRTRRPTTVERLDLASIPAVRRDVKAQGVNILKRLKERWEISRRSEFAGHSEKKKSKPNTEPDLHQTLGQKRTGGQHGYHSQATHRIRESGASQRARFSAATHRTSKSGANQRASNSGLSQKTNFSAVIHRASKSGANQRTSSSGSSQRASESGEIPRARISGSILKESFHGEISSAPTHRASVSGSSQRASGSGEIRHVRFSETIPSGRRSKTTQRSRGTSATQRPANISRPTKRRHETDTAEQHSYQDRDQQDASPPDFVSCESCLEITLEQNTAKCCDGHMICTKCLEQLVKLILSGVILGSVSCPKQWCSKSILQSDVKMLLHSLIFELLEEKWQKDDLSVLENLRRCPWCDFAAELEPGMKLFTCGKESCRKVSCIYCKQEWSTTSHDSCAADVRVNEQPVVEASAEHDTLPSHWRNMPEGLDFVAVAVDRFSSEFSEVESMFFKTMKIGRFQIKSVQRIQNLKLWQKFSLARKHLIKDIGSHDLNESRLFHGTNPESIEAICGEGFDWRVCGRNAVSYGQGTYFARGASYSHTHVARVDTIRKIRSGTLPQNPRSHAAMVHLHMQNLTGAQPPSTVGSQQSSASWQQPSTSFWSQQSSAFGAQQSSASGAQPSTSQQRSTYGTSGGRKPSMSQRRMANQIGLWMRKSGINWSSSTSQFGQQTNAVSVPLSSTVTSFTTPVPITQPRDQSSRHGGMPESVAKGNKHSFLFLARVLVGRSCIGESKMRKPPPNPFDPKKRPFNSCVDNKTNPTIFVIFDSSQSYPEYLIEYEYLL
ncbi:hypothetical protein ScPMuIL_016041 [Solemya velum]